MISNDSATPNTPHTMYAYFTLTHHLRLIFHFAHEEIVYYTQGHIL